MCQARCLRPSLPPEQEALAGGSSFQFLINDAPLYAKGANFIPQVR